MDQDIKQFVYSKNVVEFVTVANEYCNFVENAPDHEKPAYIDKLLKILSLLYLKASVLPVFEEIDDENEKFVTELDWQLIKNGNEAVLSESDLYLDFFDQEMHELPEPATSSLSENIADIYQDLKDMIEIYKLGNEELSYMAIQTCSVNFKDFWGFKVVNSLRMLHILNYSGNVKLYNLDTQKNKDKWFLSKAQQDFQEHD